MNKMNTSHEENKIIFQQTEQQIRLIKKQKTKKQQPKNKTKQTTKNIGHFAKQMNHL